MKKPSLFHVKKRTLLAVACVVWLIADINVARLGLISYGHIAVGPAHILLSLLVFAAFGAMFFKMSMKHTRRIKGYREAFRPVWHFFDAKACVIMAVMMGGGIWLRSSGLAPEVFIAVFYTGLGSALALAGLLFGLAFLKYQEEAPEQS